jgi:DNA-binding GntR family transcriptional regulator
VRFAPDEQFSQPLYELVTQVSGLSADRASEAFLAAPASASLATDLRVKKGTPVLLRRHTVFDVQGRPFEHADVHYVSERFTLTLDLKREAP